MTGLAEILLAEIHWGAYSLSSANGGGARRCRCQTDLRSGVRGCRTCVVGDRECRVFSTGAVQSRVLDLVGLIEADFADELRRLVFRR